MILSNSALILIVAAAVLLGLLSSFLINTSQLLQLVKKTTTQEKEIKLISKNAEQKITNLRKEKESISQELDRSQSSEDLKREFEQETSDLVQSNERLTQKIIVLESEADGQDPLESPLSDDRYELSEIDGIGKGYSTRLNEEGVMDSNDLAKINGDSEKIEAIAQTLGVEASNVSRWCSMAELMRVNGIRGPFAYLLEAVGVDSVKDLSTCNAQELSKQIALENANESKTPTVPSPVTIDSWIDESRKLING